MLKSHKVYASSLNYDITLERFFDRCSVEEKTIKFN